MYWFELERAVKNGCKVRRQAWKCPDRYIWYSPTEKRLYDHFKRHDKPWNSDGRDLIEASDWEIV